MGGRKVGVRGIYRGGSLPLVQALVRRLTRPPPPPPPPPPAHLGGCENGVGGGCEVCGLVRKYKPFLETHIANCTRPVCAVPGCCERRGTAVPPAVTNAAATDAMDVDPGRSLGRGMTGGDGEASTEAEAQDPAPSAAGDDDFDSEAPYVCVD